MTDELPNDVAKILAGCVIDPCGSRVTCDPPKLDTDRDFLVVIPDVPSTISEIIRALEDAGFYWEGSIHYQDAASNFMSWRRDDLNLIVTSNAEFATRHRAATFVCKRLNLPSKQDRITVFQAVLYAAQYTGEQERSA